MRITNVNLKIERQTEKAFLTNAGWLPKSVVIGKVGNNLIVEISSWIVSKNEKLQQNAEETKKESLQFNLKTYGTENPSLKQVVSKISENEEDKGKVWNPINKIWEYRN